MKLNLDRRAFLIGSGGALVALPILESIGRWGRSQAQSADSGIENFVLVFSSNGVRRAHWWPQASLSWTQLAANIRETALSQISGPISDDLGSAFDPLRNKMTLIRGADVMRYVSTGGLDHRPQVPTTGWGREVHEYQSDYESIDQIIASVPRIGGTTPIRQLSLVVKKRSQDSSVASFQRVGSTVAPVAPEYRPGVVFDTLVPQITQDPTVNERRLRVVDQIHERYRRLRDSTQLSAADREKIEVHMSLLDDQEARIRNAGSATCSVPDAPADNAQDEADIPVNMSAQIGNIALALECQLTRCVSFMLCPETDLNGGSYLSNPPGDHHELSHQNTVESNLAKSRLERWYADQVADLAQRLDAIQDPITGKTLLDKTLICWVNSAGAILEGSGEGHDLTDIPVIFLGGTGRLNAGKFIDYRNLDVTRDNVCCGGYRHTWGHQLGRPYNEVLVGCAGLMGLTASEYERDGQAGLGDYTNNDWNQYDVSYRGALPHLIV